MDEPTKEDVTLWWKLDEPRKPTGALYLLPDFYVHSYKPKPEQKHLDAMFETFGFVWKDAP